MFDTAIIGTGPAGISAALTLKALKKDIILFGSGQLSQKIRAAEQIRNYPGLSSVTGAGMQEAFLAQLRDMEIPITEKTVTGIYHMGTHYSILCNQEAFDAKTVILCTGVESVKPIEGELEFVGRGVSYCATCDGMFFRKKEVAVVGGGNTAVQDALVLSEYCSRVYLIHRRSELRAEESLCKQMFARENIEFIGETVIEELQGEGSLESLTLRNVTTGAIQYLPVSALFEAIGQLPQNAVFSHLVDLDADGYFITDNNCATSCRGIFAAGDACRKSVRQLTTAVSDGTIAALSAVEYLR